MADCTSISSLMVSFSNKVCSKIMNCPLGIIKQTKEIESCENIRECFTEKGNWIRENESGDFKIIFLSRV